MILISHRGNINGRFESRENDPSYIDVAIKEGFDVEVDVWYINNGLYLGHDKPQYVVDFRWFRDRLNHLWIHCKNTESLSFFNSLHYPMNYFWHQEDTLTLTSRGHIWVYPGNQPIKNSIAVLPELFNDNLDDCIGICSDFISNYKTNT